MKMNEFVSYQRQHDTSTTYCKQKVSPYTIPAGAVINLTSTAGLTLKLAIGTFYHDPRFTTRVLIFVPSTPTISPQYPFRFNIVLAG